LAIEEFLKRNNVKKDIDEDDAPFPQITSNDSNIIMEENN
jgi:hypothetical protein